MSRGLILLFAVATGQAVASNYLAQPLLETIRDLFGVSAAVAGLIVTAAQIGYAAGLILLLPLGDLFERRRLITTLAVVTACGLAAAAAAPSIGLFIAAVGVIGLTSVMAQLLVPFAATLSPESERGRVVGTVMSGLLFGILLARTFSGLVAEVAGWRAVYALAAALMAAQAVVLYAKLPRYHQSAGLTYPRLLASVVGHRSRRAGAAPARALRLARVRVVQRAVDHARLLALRTALRLRRRRHRPLQPRRRGRRAHRVGRRPLHRSRLGVRAHRRVVGLMPAGFALLWLGDHSLARAAHRHPRARRGLQRRPHQQPERDLPPAIGGAQPHQRVLHDVLLRGGGRRLRHGRPVYDRWGWTGSCGLGLLVAVAAIARWATDRQRPLGEREPVCEAAPPA